MSKVEIDMARHAREIARALGDGWTSELQPEYGFPAAWLHGPSGAKLHLVAGPFTAPGRLVINGSLDHQYVYGAERNQEITVSLSKPAATVARDITRRLQARGAWRRLRPTRYV